jgi:predicted acylesterase/phospholipase RssA
MEQTQQSQSNLETILVLQGGGSLGAYECGAFKTLANNGIKFDILAGSSIGAVNASIICSAQNANLDAAKGFRRILDSSFRKYRDAIISPNISIIAISNVFTILVTRENDGDNFIQLFYYIWKSKGICTSLVFV